MRSLRKTIKRKKELKTHRPEMLQVQQQLSDHLNQKLQLKPASGKAGQDQIYNAYNGQKIIAIVRIQNKNIPDEPPKWNFRNALELQPRMENEWNAYSMLSSQALSPTPLWRNEIAIACSWVNANRASRRFIHAKKDFWVLVEIIFDAVCKMHNCGITHMDLNLGNILINQTTNDITFIDFEFAPADWVSPNQQRICDFLCLLNEFCKKRRGGKIMLSNPKHMIQILKKYIRPEDQNIQMNKIVYQLDKLSRQTEFCNELNSIFPNLKMHR